MIVMSHECHVVSNHLQFGFYEQLVQRKYWWLSARRHNSIANALELCLSCTNPSIWKLPITGSLWGESTSYPSSNVKRASTSWCHVIIDIKKIWRWQKNYKIPFRNPMKIPKPFPGLDSGGWFNIKMSSYEYRKSHCGDKTVIRSSYLHNGNSFTGKITSLYWIRAQVTSPPGIDPNGETKTNP